MGYTTGAMSLILTFILLLSLIIGSVFIESSAFNGMIEHLDLSDGILASLLVLFVTLQSNRQSIR